MIDGRVRRIAAWAAALLVGGAAVAQSAKQAAYNAAQAAFDKGDWTAAAAGFEPLLLPAGRSSRIDGIIRSRLAETLSRLDDQSRAEAEAARAVEEFPPSGPDTERAMAYLTLATIRHHALDYPGAIAAYDKARAAAGADYPSMAETDIGEINAAMTAAPRTAGAVAEAVIANAARFNALPAVSRAQFLTLAARARLNANDLPGALAFSRKAIALVGASGSSVNIIQAQVRGDAALIYLKLNRADEAREALAFSGGGYMPNNSWINHTTNDLPTCDDDLHPDDVAVIELGIGTDGTVGTALPIYASRPGPVGAAFARAIQSWSFDPQDVAKLASFWRYGVRVEVRCLTRPASTSLDKPFVDATLRWIDTQGGSMDFDRVRVPIASPLYPSLSEAAGSHRKRPKGDIVAAWADLARVAAARGAPADVQLYLGYRAIPYGSGSTRVNDAVALATRGEAMPGGGGAAAWLLLDAAIRLEGSGNFAKAAPLLERVLATPEDRLEANDPVRLVATLHRALVDRKLGDAKAAEARLTQAGLSAEQCSLFDVKPLPINTQMSDNDFPQAALKWQMEGFAREAFDIGADGRVVNVRTVLAYPAFVFGPGTEKAVGRFRYLPPTLNNVALGCASQRQSVSYVVPGR